MTLFEYAASLGMLTVLSAGIVFGSERAQSIVSGLSIAIHLVTGGVFIAPESFGAAP